MFKDGKVLLRQSSVQSLESKNSKDNKKTGKIELNKKVSRDNSTSMEKEAVLVVQKSADISIDKEEEETDRKEMERYRLTEETADVRQSDRIEVTDEMQIKDDDLKMYPANKIMKTGKVVKRRYLVREEMGLVEIEKLRKKQESLIQPVKRTKAKKVWKKPTFLEKVETFSKSIRKEYLEQSRYYESQVDETSETKEVSYRGYEEYTTQANKSEKMDDDAFAKQLKSISDTWWKGKWVEKNNNVRKRREVVKPMNELTYTSYISKLRDF